MVNHNLQKNKWKFVKGMIDNKRFTTPKIEDYLRFLDEFSKYKDKLQDPLGDDDFCKYDTNLDILISGNFIEKTKIEMKKINKFKNISIKEKDSSVCNGSFDDLTRDKMPQVIDSEINTVELEQLTIDQLKELNDIKPLSIKNLIEKFKETPFPKLNKDDTKNAQIYMALIFYISNGTFNETKLTELKKSKTSIKAFIEGVDELNIATNELHKRIEELIPSQNEVKAGKTLGIALNIFRDTCLINKTKKYLKQLKEIFKNATINSDGTDFKEIMRHFSIEKEDYEEIIEYLKNSSEILDDEEELEKKIKEYRDKDLDKVEDNKVEEKQSVPKIEETIENLRAILPLLQLPFDINSNLSKEINKFTTGILVSNDDYVIDGHHRWSACLLLKKIIDSLPNEKFKFPETVTLQQVNLSFNEYYCKIMNHPLVYSASKEEELITPKKPSTVICPQQPGGSRKKRSLKKRKKKTRKQKGNKKKKTNIKRKN